MVLPTSRPRRVGLLAGILLDKKSKSPLNQGLGAAVTNDYECIINTEKEKNMKILFSPKSN